MITIYKYELDTSAGSVCPTEIKQGAEILSVAFQGDTLQIWAKVETEAGNTERIFHVYGTGHRIKNSERLTFIGTVFTGQFVFHVFEEVRL